MDNQLGPLRPLSDDERRIIVLLVARAQVGLQPGWLDAMQVQAMDDGGMGSLRIAAKDGHEAGRLFGGCVSDYQFDDEDGVAVIASLYIDQNGDMFELDMWKTDFAALIRIPEQLE